MANGPMIPAPGGAIAPRLPGPQRVATEQAQRAREARLDTRQGERRADKVARFERQHPPNLAGATGATLNRQLRRSGRAVSRGGGR